MTPSERLVQRLRAMGLDIPEDATVRRTYAGRHQRNAGAWSWFLDIGRPYDIGSQYPVTTLLQGRLHVTRDIGSYSSGDITVDPYQPDRKSARGGLSLDLVEAER